MGEKIEITIVNREKLPRQLSGQYKGRGAVAEGPEQQAANVYNHFIRDRQRATSGHAHSSTVPEQLRGKRKGRHS